MCGRTALTASPAELREIFGLDAAPALVPRYNVTPSQGLVAVRAVLGEHGRAARGFTTLRWGLVPAGADAVKIGQRLTLARAETVATLPAFRDALRARRCLVVVSGFYEWKRDGERRPQPYLLRRGDGAPFALAGIWERWTSRDGEVVESCAVLTQRALPPVDAIHHRMPVVMPASAWDTWLDPRQGCADADAALAALLQPRPPPLIAAPVSTYVNDPRHDDPRCFEPPALAAPPAQGSLF